MYNQNYVSKKQYFINCIHWPGLEFKIYCSFSLCWVCMFYVLIQASLTWVKGQCRFVVKLNLVAKSPNGSTTGNTTHTATLSTLIQNRIILGKQHICWNYERTNSEINIPCKTNLLIFTFPVPADTEIFILYNVTMISRKQWHIRLIFLCPKSLKYLFY